MLISLIVSIALTAIVSALTAFMLPKVAELLMAAGLQGKDLHKKGTPAIPETLGVLIGAMYMVHTSIYIPFPFLNYFFGHGIEFPHHKLSEYLVALLSICCMLLLGFADDVLNLRWRDKVLMPSIATIPILMVYYVNGGVTDVAVPLPLQSLLNAKVVDLGIAYYMYMGMLAVFCTNSINILAGANGLEVGQSVIIAICIAIQNGIQVKYGDVPALIENNLFSLYLIIPFIGLSLVLLKFNWYPAKVFVGDTYCYFAGMTFAVVGILGHFSKTMFLFFIPQLLNFLISLPQLFRIVPCPRHRIPKFNQKTGKLENSYFELSNINVLQKAIINLFSAFKICVIIEENSKDKRMVKVSNFTLLNTSICLFGPLREDQLVISLLLFQVLCSVFAFIVRYYISYLVY